MAAANSTALLLACLGELHATQPSNGRPPVYKAIGISLAIASGLFIGTSFVLKKTGLLKANVKYNEEAGEGYGYLKNAYWWTGMTLMIIGEICNFVAYAFVDAILVTPLGALSVVITTILSAIFLKERLSFVGKIGCFQCIIGSIVIVMNAPAQSSAADIQEMRHFVAAPGFLVYAGIVIIGCAFVAFWVGPRYGKKSMLVYLTICSLIGGLSVVSTQGLGAAIVTQAGGKNPQFNQWFLYVLFAFVITTLVTEIIFLNVSPKKGLDLMLRQNLTIQQKALNLFNAALVTPTYYVYFTSATIVTSAILFQGFKGTPTSIITVVLGFLVICSGVVLLQLSKSAKDVPDAAVFKGDLDQVRTVAEQAEPESEPKADAIRGAAGIVRRLSQARQKTELAEAKRVWEEKMKDQMEPIDENEQVEWDGLRRRKTVINGAAPGSLKRQKTIHPPLGMANFPDDDPLWDVDESRPASADVHGGSGLHGGFLSGFRRKSSRLNHTQSLSVRPVAGEHAVDMTNRPVTTIAAIPPKTGELDTAYHGAQPTDGSMEMGHVLGLPHGLTPPDRPGHGKPIMWADNVDDRRPTSSRGHSSGHLSAEGPTPPAHSAKRQFSFQTVFHRHHNKDGKQQQPPDPHPTPMSPGAMSFTEEDTISKRPTSRLGLGSRGNSNSNTTKDKTKLATEEERLGLVKGDSSNTRLPIPEYDEPDEDWDLEEKHAHHLLSQQQQQQQQPRELDAAEVTPLAHETSRTPLIREGWDQYADDEEVDAGAGSPRPPLPAKNSPRLGPGAGGQRKHWEGGGGGGSKGSGGGPAFI